MLTLIVGCNKKTNYATEKPFIIANWSPAGPDDYRNLYSQNVAIDHNGTLTLYTEGNDGLKIGNDAPILKFQLDDDEINKIKEFINKQRFWALPEDVSTPSEDGSFSYITVNLTDETKTIGGLNPDHPQFNEIHNYIFDLIDKEDYKAWTEDIEEHIWEMNPDP